MMGIDSGMTVDELLYSDSAIRVYEYVCRFFTDDELKKYMFLLADYCNEKAIHNRIQQELAENDLIVDYTNKFGATNADKNKLTMLLRESSDRVLKLSKELRLTPKASGGTSEIDASDLDVD